MSENIKLQLQSDALEMVSPIVEDVVVCKDAPKNYTKKFLIKRVSEVRKMINVSLKSCYLKSRSKIFLILIDRKIWQILHIHCTYVGILYFNHVHVDGRK